jgi:hypothetical protein
MEGTVQNGTKSKSHGADAQSAAEHARRTRFKELRRAIPPDL